MSTFKLDSTEEINFREHEDAKERRFFSFFKKENIVGEKKIKITKANFINIVILNPFS